MLIHTHNLYQDSNYNATHWRLLWRHILLCHNHYGGITIDFYSEIGGIDLLCSPVSYVYMYLYTPLCICYVLNTD